ncbi:hypothetical protein [Xenorhabdus bovienii]|uniref:hypothetical protein n=1 Tax=Xenorhabdus bovienii TaxID=40576 RepID=UPI003DA52C76
MSSVSIKFSDGRNDVVGVDNANAILREVGVRISLVSIPEEAKPIIKVSKTRATNDEEKKKLISIFNLNRADFLEQIRLAGRTPAVNRGGYLSTTEVDVPPYPKVYDMKEMTDETKKYVLSKFGRLHVNSSEDGSGIDEVMTVISGGPLNWFFVLNNGVTANVLVNEVGPNDQAIRLSYPGLGPHGGFINAAQGLLVAYAHGPETFVMRYEDPSVAHSEMLNTNPWMDFSGDRPKLLDKVK